MCLLCGRLRGRTVYQGGNVRPGAVCTTMWPGCRRRVNGRAQGGDVAGGDVGRLCRGDDGTGEAAAGGASRRRWRHPSEAAQVVLACFWAVRGRPAVGHQELGENGAAVACPLVNAGGWDLSVLVRIREEAVNERSFKRL